MIWIGIIVTSCLIIVSAFFVQFMYNKNSFFENRMSETESRYRVLELNVRRAQERINELDTNVKTIDTKHADLANGVTRLDQAIKKASAELIKEHMEDKKDREDFDKLVTELLDLKVALRELLAEKEQSTFGMPKLIDLMIKIMEKMTKLKRLPVT